MSNNQFKIVLVGSEEVGKTTYLASLLAGKFTCNNVANLGVVIYSLKFHTNNQEYPEIEFNVSDCASHTRNFNMVDGYYIGADAMIAMFDVTNSNSFLKVKKNDCWSSQCLRDIPQILVGNKVDTDIADIAKWALFPEQISAHINKSVRMEKAKYVEISVKSNYNLEKPWLELARKLTSDSNLEFTSGPF